MSAPHLHTSAYGPPPPPPGGFGPPPGGFGPPGGDGFGPPGGGYGPPPGAYGVSHGAGPWGAPPGAILPAAPFGIHPISGLPYSEKSKVVAGLLQLFVPCAGRFYTGHTNIALIQFGVMVVTCGFGAVWPMVDGIMMLMGKVTDSDGHVLREGL